MKNRMKLALSVLAVGVLLSGACQDLDIENTNSPDRRAVLFDAAALEQLVFSIQQNALYNVTHNTRAIVELFPAYGEDAAHDNSSFDGFELLREPRESLTNTAQTAAHDRWLRTLWTEMNEGLASANEALWAIREAGMVVLTDDGAGNQVDNTARLEVLAKFMQGVTRGYVAITHDVGFEVDETNIIAVEDNIDNAPPPTAYGDYIPFALDELDEAAALAAAADFTVPADRGMLVGLEVTDELVQVLANGFAARLGSSVGRTPDERANLVNWARALQHAQNGPDADVYMMANRSFGNTRSRLMWRSERSTSTEFHLRLDYRMLGPADVSGQFQTWWTAPLGDQNRFILTGTPDRRIAAADGGDGKYMEFREANPMPSTDEPYRHSYYQYYRWENAARTNHQEGPIPLMTVTEMDLIAAEANIRLGNNQAAADLINKTRVAIGELPPVTAAGVPAGADCVPKKPTGECGSLLDALWHERKLELFGLDALMSWYTNRGFTDGLPCGTATQLPRHERELVSLGVPVYTFGGTPYGAAGSADCSVPKNN